MISAVAGAFCSDVSVILECPLPLSRTAVIVVTSPGSLVNPDLLLTCHALLPPTSSLHCVGRDQLAELVQPSLMAGLEQAVESILLALCLQARARPVWRRGRTPTLPAPRRPAVMLGLHLEACALYVRSHYVLEGLRQGRYLELVRLLVREMHRLAFTSVVAARPEAARHSDAKLWALFAAEARDPEGPTLLRGLTSAVERLPASAAVTEPVAIRATWIFEQFLRVLWDRLPE